MSFDFIKDKNKHIHFIGIGGISMSGLAEILLYHNFTVSGSDMNSSPMTEKLKEKGANIYIGHKKENIKDADLIVYTAAISEDNPEIIEAKEKNIKLMDRADFLGNLMKGYKYNVAVSGTHGKTTTTSMLSHVALKANVDPTILVGGNLDIIDGNVRVGKSDFFLTEACEYKSSFLKFFPYIGVILNIDADHLDYYKDLDDIKNAFSKFIKLIPKDGYLVAYGEDKNIQSILKEANCNVVTYGIDSGDIQASNIKYDEKACGNFDVVKNNEKLFSVKLNVPGKHNILNSLASICVALVSNMKNKDIVEGIESFFGTHRRFELKGHKNNVTVIDDYAHHPTEISATLSAAKKYPHKRIFCVFQPHTYSRTLTLFDDFTKCFDDADEIILADIYAAREKDTGVISSDMLGDKLKERGLKCANFHNFDDIKNYLIENAKSGDLILTVGAGDIYKVGEMYINL
ncbi:UDP-N-acetylmuramate--L-alanine ligase [Clostridium sp. FAM 1755]|uniref:UDP-N-acetylmuramate--L-alanine ligase n=1 Tax=Clostridium TaxID=1485 RepID=UPI0006ABD3F8|nr:UDP-N-acetylmuramate--L-alanine ligase [Clostridium sp. L74]KOR26177.1 UDP-N-acetylmuramate--alanine ligase [Clostridium sp. L74]NFV14350.1 UDP-N-acetylmuramate--L-alanine ligase [Clostridium sporogenes]